MGYLSRNNLEKIATRIFNDYKHLPRFAGQQVDHVDPEILACGLCGLRIDHFHLSKDGLTLGMTAFKEIGVEVYDDSGQPFFYYLDGRTLLVEADLKNDPTLHGRYHFTTAHETAHQILADLYPTNRVIQNRIIYYNTPSMIGASGRLTIWPRRSCSPLKSYIVRSANLTWGTVLTY